jgi:hypothetical protein
MALERINLEHLPASHAIHAALFRNVQNASFLHQQLLAGNTDFEYALIDASVVSTVSLFPVRIPTRCLLRIPSLSIPLQRFSVSQVT